MQLGLALGQRQRLVPRVASYLGRLQAAPQSGRKPEHARLEDEVVRACMQCSDCEVLRHFARKHEDRQVFVELLGGLDGCKGVETRQVVIGHDRIDTPGSKRCPHAGFVLHPLRPDPQSGERLVAAKNGQQQLEVEFRVLDNQQVNRFALVGRHWPILRRAGAQGPNSPSFFRRSGRMAREGIHAQPAGAESVRFGPLIAHLWPSCLPDTACACGPCARLPSRGRPSTDRTSVNDADLRRARCCKNPADSARMRSDRR
jgi:hypothetical protein